MLDGKKYNHKYDRFQLEEKNEKNWKLQKISERYATDLSQINSQAIIFDVQSCSSEH